MDKYLTSQEKRISINSFSTQFVVSVLVAVAVLAAPMPSLAKDKSPQADLSQQFLKILFSDSEAEQQAAALYIEKHWYPELSSMALESLRFVSDSLAYKTLSNLIAKEIGEGEFRGTPGSQYERWYRWLWNSGMEMPAGYANFKAAMYKTIDPRFEDYFKGRQSTAQIRLDEIQWGGVAQDGIPPLRQPKMVEPSKAKYLQDSNIVYGIYLNGEAKAYPKRILAWHEMFVDTIGGIEIAGVYCTLCGAVIPYRTTYNGKRYELGTSGFLYRSNKLMYDKATQSLWSTHQGKPVLGDLVGQGIQLSFEAVVTTTWGEWRKRHPNTLVLSADTGHYRDYGEGVAYADYFATDKLMFKTPFQDKRLNNKQEVLALRFPAAPSDQLAIDTEFLNENPVYHTRIGSQDIVVFTDATGANRVYDPKGFKFTEYDGDKTVRTKKGKQWTLTEQGLENTSGKKLPRLPAHRAFWFGWQAAYPETKLIK